jgi:hypothetical protein
MRRCVAGQLLQILQIPVFRVNVIPRPPTVAALLND